MHDLEQIKADNPLREWVEKDAGQPTGNKNNPFWQCPLHDDSNASFTVYPDGGFYCFGCDKYGDLFDYLELTRGWDLAEAIDRLGGGAEITQEQRLEREVKRAKVQQERLDREIANAENVLEALRSERAWEQYHTNLLDSQQAQDIWASQGLPYEWQVTYDLGYAPGFYEGPSITMPVFTPFDKAPVNIRHRIIGRDGDKYRPEKAGLPTSFYWAMPKLGATERLFLVEGEKKAMVLFLHLYNAGLTGTQVIGVMGAKGNIKPELVPQLADTKSIYYIPDPDVDKPKIYKTLKTLGKPASLISLPNSVDDMLNANIIDGSQVIALTHNAVKVDI